MLRLLGVGLVVVAVGVAACAEPKQLEFDGKHLSHWLTELSARDRTARDRAAGAVAAIVKSDLHRVVQRPARNERGYTTVDDSLLLKQPALLTEPGNAVVPVVAGLLKDDDLMTRLRAAQLLAAIGPKAAAAAPTLRAALEDPSWELRRHAAVALARVDPKEVEAMVAFLLKAPADDGQARRSFHQWENHTTLPEIGADAVPYLVARLAHEDATTRDRAGRALCMMGEPAVAGLIKGLSAETPALRAGAARCLGRMAIESPARLQALRGALTDGEREVRLTAAESLGKAEVDATVPALLEVLTAGDVQQRGRAAVAIRSIGEPARAAAKPAVPALEKQLQTKDGALDLDVADALVYIDSSRAQRVSELLAQKTVTGQNEVQVLVRLGKAAPTAVPAVVAALVGILNNSPKGVAQQREAVQALGQFGTAAKAAAPDLIALAKGTDPALARLASRIMPLIDPEATDYPRDLQSPPYNPNEALQPAFSLTKAVDYLDMAAQDWMRAESCGGCHANYTYMMVRPRLTGPAPLIADTRGFIEAKGEKPSVGRRLEGAIVSDAAALAFDDARTGKLQPITRQALDRMWKILPINSCNKDTIVVELSPDFAAALAIVAAHVAPEGYAQTEPARNGLAATSEYLRKNVKAESRASLHSRALLLWASAYQQGLLTAAERESIVQSFVAQQQKEGGWSLASLDRESRAAKQKDAPSDGYGTGFTVYMLRQAGIPANQPEIVRAVQWLRTNQRASGRWFTPSHSAHRITSADFGTRDFYSQTVGTAFALLALESCGALQTAEGPRDGAVPPRSIGIDRIVPNGAPSRK